MPPREQVARETKTSDQQAAFHLDQSTQSQLAITGEILAAAAVVAMGARSRTVTKICEIAVPVVEDAALSIWGNVARLTNRAPKFRFVSSHGIPAAPGASALASLREHGADLLDGKNAFECALGTDTRYLNNASAVITLSDRAGTEVRLFRNGSRTVARQGQECFFDQAGVGLHVPTAHTRLPSVTFQNDTLTPVNRKLYSKIENCMWTGYIKPLYAPNFVGDAARFWAED